jgi:SAM-dependent methyltransferase
MSESRRDDAANSYALGRSDEETARLILQHQIYGPLTRQFLVTAGVTAGMKVLDLGCGAGDVALLLAELVGPQGEVLGVDQNPQIVETARSRVQAAGWTNVAVQHADLQELQPGDDFDAVVGRWVLMYVAEPAELLRRATGWLRPGGIVAFQEGDLRSPVRCYPPAPFHEQAVRWTTPPPGAPGPDVDMGPKLFATFLAAGLSAPQLRLNAPIGGGPSWPGYGYLASTLRSLLPFLVQLGVVESGAVDLETAEARLRDEVVAQNGVQILPAVIGAWARTNGG